MRLSRLQIAVHAGALGWLAWLAWAFFTHHLTANPIRELTLRTGQTALILLMLSLACTPLNTFLGWSGVMRVRRALGLYAFGYACVHLLIFVYDNGWILGEGFDATLVYRALFDKRYALAGLAAFLCLLPLAITSTQGWVRRLGRHWQTLHRLAYGAALLAVVHFIWLVKADLREPLIYGALVGLLLLVRLPAAVAQALRRGR
jgi:methionine sulfoxide reductase heme-binding subunit